jgi:di- and tripeptidase
MPALSHLLSIEQGKVLSLAADEQYVYAGCQSEDNEITVCLFKYLAEMSLIIRYSLGRRFSPCSGF